MANQFYSGQWNPVRHGYYPLGRVHPTSTKPKVVNIPVHFFGSNEVAAKPAIEPLSTMEKREAAAVKIQKAVRGFLVRKNASVVRRVAAEVDDIERKVKKEDMIGRDSKEWLKVTEALMSLLLRLDSVRGVRDFRKKVINRVIRLQEAIDSISGEAQEPCKSVDQATTSEESECQGKALDEETEISMADESIDGTRNLSSVIIGNDFELREVDGDFSMSAVLAEPEGSMAEAVEQISLDREEPAVQNRNMEAEMEMETISASERKSNHCRSETSHDIEAIDCNSSAIDVSFSQGQRNREESRFKEGSLETSTGLEESEAHIQQNSTGGIHGQTTDEVAEVSMVNEQIDRGKGPSGVEGSNAAILTEDETEEREGSRSLIAEQILLNNVETRDQKLTMDIEMAMIPEKESKVNLCSVDTNEEGDVIDPKSVAAQSEASLDHYVSEGEGLLEMNNTSGVGIRDDTSRSLWETSGEERREMTEVMRRMAIENERLKEMVAEMCARSAEQCRLVEGIVGRVEQLERAVHRMENRRKKRKSGAAYSTLSSAK
ncbi:hypothetical protein HPP92_006390 [Vanilla planifolia]|uniref:BAG domain-containing protein n=1 Tax=Vanilla planifolia TaxID=51239 RepID=A0A835RWE6_VANPL|nr:hypothetical protein HPP92_006390 [Vanilla planifolia]